MRVVEPRRRWQIPVGGDVLVCSALAYSRRAAPESEGHALRSALVDRLVTLSDDEGEARQRLARLDALPDEEGWSRWQVAVFVARAWDDDAAIDLAFSLWDAIGEATYRREVRAERPRLTLAERYGWPAAISPATGDDSDTSESRRSLRRARVRWALVDLPLHIYADLDTRTPREDMAARARMIGAMAALMALGGGIGAGIAALRGRPAEDGFAAGMGAAIVVAVLYLLMMLSMVAGLSLMSMTQRRAVPDGRTRSGRRDAVVGTPWVVAVFVAIIGGLVLVTAAVAWVQAR